ncbi:MAG: DNA primase [Prevotella sp.]|nr:DNA primase [Prevotella sp.]
MIDRATVDKIMDAANIVDVVSEFVTLRKSGANYKGLCPFHNERTPSFYVSPARGICKCFSCGKGGNPVGFIMEHEQMTYPEALRWLAKKYNIEIKERELTNEEREAESKRESMFIVNEWAADYFEDILHNHVDGVAIGMQYFRKRGIRDDIIRKFRLGFDLPDGYTLPREARKKGYQEEFLTETGICYRRENDNQLVDRFAGRVIFPWIGMSGKVVAFGGRKLDAATKGVQQKYVNSPDSEIYHKEQQLYGIYQAKKAIAKENLVYMVEGYTDVIAMHQCGLENVVANSGTALSVHQIRMLRRFTPNIVLLYDGDEAGIHAAMRGTDMLLQEGMNIKVLLLPDGDDPDSFSRKHNAQEFKQYIEEHQKDFIQFKSDLMLRGVSDPIKRSEAINSIVRSISVIPDQIVRATYITDCSHRLGINEATLISSMNKMIREGKSATRSLPKGDEHHYAQEQNTPAQHATPLATQRGSEGEAAIESMLIRTIIRHGGETLYDNVETDDGATISLTVAQYINFNLSTDGLSFSNPIYNKVLEEAARYTTDDNFDSATYFTRHPDVEISSLATDMLVDPVQLSKSLQMRKEENSLQNHIEHLILDFRLNYVDSHMKDVQRQIILNASDPERMVQLMQQYKELQEVRNQLAKKLGSNILV